MCIRDRSRAYRCSFLGKEEEVLLEERVSVDGTDYMIGHTLSLIHISMCIRDRDRDYLCRLSEIASDAVEAEVLEEREETTELPAKIWLFQGLPKSDKMELIIQKAVELGAYQVVPVATKRAVVKLDKKKEEAK